MSEGWVLGRSALPGAVRLRPAVAGNASLRISRARIATASLGFSAFSALAIAAYHAPPFPLDLAITHAMQTLHGAWIEWPLGALSAIGFPPVVGFLYGGIVVALFLIGARREALGAAFATLGSAGLHRLAADLVGRTRPTPDLVHVAHQLPVHSSFPAGHVLNATAFLGFLCYLLLARVAPSRARTLAWMVLMLAIGGMGLARVYFGEHWPSDVLGGYLLGAAWLCIAIEFDRWLERRAIWRRAAASAAWWMVVACVGLGTMGSRPAFANRPFDFSDARSRFPTQDGDRLAFEASGVSGVTWQVGPEGTAPLRHFARFHLRRSH